MNNAAFYTGSFSKNDCNRKLIVSNADEKNDIIVLEKSRTKTPVNVAISVLLD